MSEPQARSINFRDFYNLLRHQKEQDARRLDQLKVLIAEVPVAPEVLSEVVWLGPGERSEVLSKHPGQRIDRKLQSLWHMLEIFGKAHSDIVSQLDAFHDFCLTDEMHLPTGKPKLEAIRRALNKELVAFAAAAAALVYFTRRLRSESDLPDIKNALAASFDRSEHDFVIALRNVICHEHFPDVGWQIEYGRDKERRTDFILSVVRLKQETNLSTNASAYIDRFPEGIRLRSLVDSYAQRVNAFYSWYRDACSQLESSALEDYQRVVSACNANASRTTYRLLLSQYLSRKIDPYQHLHKYLLPHQIEEAMKLPFRSKRQVDYIIQIADKHNACDEELRSMIYRLFEVAS